MLWTATSLADGLGIRSPINRFHNTLDPAIAYYVPLWQILGAVCDGLVRRVASPVPARDRLALARDYRLSSDGRVHTFTLDTERRFHNGDRLQAADVRFSLERMLAAETHSPGAVMFQTILGYGAFRRGDSARLAGLRTPDARTVVIETEHPYPAMLDKLALPFGCVLSRRATAATAGALDYPVSTGPFRVTHVEMGNIIRLERVDATGDGFEHAAQWLEFVVEDSEIRAHHRWAQGDFDVLFQPRSQYLDQLLDENGSHGGREVPSDHPLANFITRLSLDHRTPPLGDLRVRQAISHAIDREQFNGFYGPPVTPTQQFLPPGVVGHLPAADRFAHDPARAMSLLREAGYPDGFKLILNIPTRSERYRKLAAVVEQALAKSRIWVEIRHWDDAAEYDRRRNLGELPGASLYRWLMDYLDPATVYMPTLSEAAIGEQFSNFSGYRNPSLDRLAERAMLLEPGSEEHRVLWERVFEAIYHDQPEVPLITQSISTLLGARLCPEFHGAMAGVQDFSEARVTYQIFRHLSVDPEHPLNEPVAHALDPQ